MGELEKEPDPGPPLKKRPDPNQYEIRIRWEKARRVLDISATGVRFEFDSPLKIGNRYPMTLTAPGISLSETLEVVRCEMTVDPALGRFFRITGRFFPQSESSRDLS